MNDLPSLLLNATYYKGFHITLRQKGDGFLPEVRYQGMPCFEGELSKAFESKDWAFTYALHLIDEQGGDTKITPEETDPTVEDIENLGLDPYAYRIFHHIAIKGGEEGCHRTISGLAKHCRISKGRVTEAIKTLLELGLIQKNGIFYRIKK